MKIVKIVKMTHWGAKDVWGLLKLNSGRSQISATQHLSFSASQLLSISASQLLGSSLLREPGRSFLGPQGALYRKKSFHCTPLQGTARPSAPQQLFPCVFGVQKQGGRWIHVFGDLSKEYLDGFWGAISSFL